MGRLGVRVVPCTVVLVFTFASKRHMVPDMTPDFPPPWGPDFLDIAVAFDIFLNTLTHTLLYETLRHVDGILDRFGGGAPVANNTGAVDPEERDQRHLYYWPRELHPQSGQECHPHGATFRRGACESTYSGRYRTQRRYPGSRGPTAAENLASYPEPYVVSRRT